MVEIVIDGVKWRCPISWNEITVAKGREIDRVIKRADCEIRGIIANPEQPQILSTQQRGALRRSYLHTVSILAEIPIKIIEKIEPIQLDSFIQRYIAPLMADIESGAVMAYAQIKKDKTLTPCGKLDAEQFCRVTDLYIEDRMKNATQIAEIVLGKRSEVGDNTAMKSIWSAFYSLSEAHKYLKENFPESRKKYQDKGIITHWREIPIVVAGGKASEIELVKGMKWHRMMELFECQTKMDRER